MYHFKKIIFASALLLTVFAGNTSYVSAEETETTVTTTITEEAASEVTSEIAGTASVTSTTEITDMTDVANNLNKYYLDSKYDTKGNATLIKEETVIYKSEEMQFIAVTTKDGSVFYVLINYSAAGNEDNVYFLNKVDDYDLYALLYAGDDEETKIYDVGAAAEAAEKANEKNPVVTSIPEDTDSEEAAEPVSQTTDMTTILIAGTVVILASAGGFVFFKINKTKKAKKDSIDYDDDLEIDEE
ncbi:MAG: DUF4366 domain-containing protein [Oscillospiraceae bacterium]|nr:DUF4366 domain-containing protein [Oscillospiraceae bacterium]